MIQATAKVIDRELALRRAGGSRELADELFAMLLKELPLVERALREHHGRRAIGELHDTVHKLNGATTYCGVPALQGAAAALDQLLKRRQDVFEDELSRLLEEIRRLLSGAGERV